MTRVSELTSHVTNDVGNHYLTGGWEPVSAEIDEPALTVKGELPAGLRGSFIRNGPNPMFEPISEYHMVDGDGMRHEVAFDNGKASYRNRWIQTAGLGVEMREGHGIYPGLGDIANWPDQSVTGDAGPVKNPANTHIIRHAGRYFALWEGGLPTEVTADLETIGNFDYDGQVDGVMPAMSAHPRLDPRTGEMFSFRYSPFPPFIQYFVIDATGNLVHKVDIDLPAPVMMHDFLITEQYAVFLDSPIVMNIGGDDGGPVAKWMPENGARFGVMPRMGTAEDLKWYDIDVCHVQHFWNAWDDGDRIELRGARWTAVDFGYESDGSSVEVDPALPAKFWIDRSSDKAGWEHFDDLGGEMCRFNDDFNGVYNRYDYMAAHSLPEAHLGGFDSVARYDAETGERQVWDFGGERYVGEPVFAPDPASSDEADGWLLALAYDRGAAVGELHVFEASRIDDGPMAVVGMPQFVGSGFHANWFPA